VIYIEFTSKDIEMLQTKTVLPIGIN